MHQDRGDASDELQADRLGRTLQTVQDQYVAFAMTRPPEDDKKFAARHAAGKAAVAHIAALYKLLHLAEDATAGEARAAAIPADDLLASARHAMAEFDVRAADDAAR